MRDVATADYLTVDEAAEILDMNRSTLYRAIQAGEVQATPRRRRLRGTQLMCRRSEIERLARELGIASRPEAVA